MVSIVACAYYDGIERICTGKIDTNYSVLDYYKDRDCIKENMIRIINSFPKNKKCMYIKFDIYSDKSKLISECIVEMKNECVWDWKDVQIENGEGE